MGPSSPEELENLRRSIVMLRPGQPALDRETALDLLDQLGERFDRHRQARRLAAEMQRVLDEGERP